MIWYYKVVVFTWCFANRVFQGKELENLAAMDTELQKIAAKLHDNTSAWNRTQSFFKTDQRRRAASYCMSANLVRLQWEKKKKSGAKKAACLSVYLWYFGVLKLLSMEMVLMLTYKYIIWTNVRLQKYASEMNDSNHRVLKSLISLHSIKINYSGTKQISQMISWFKKKKTSVHTEVSFCTAFFILCRYRCHPQSSCTSSWTIKQMDLSAGIKK